MSSFQRQQEPTGDPTLGFESARDLDAITAHIERHWGKIDLVLHETWSQYVHLDIQVLYATEERPYHLLFTTGMSDRPMQVREGYEDFGYAELMLALPPEWPLDMDSFRDERHYWPIRQLKAAARYPHAYSTWLWILHTVGSDHPAETFAPGVPFSGAMLYVPTLPEDGLPEQALTLQIAPEKRIHFLSFLPLYPQELQYARQHGSGGVIDRLEWSGVTELVDLDRPSVIAT